MSTKTVQAEPTEETPLMVSLDEAAAVLGCHPRTISRMCERGELKGARAGNRWRINREALYEYAGLA